MDKTSTNSVNVDENSFDYICIICAATIFLGHFLTHFNYESVPLNFIAYFVRGVPVFFCLSGFFCARSIDRYSKTEFLKKRFIRLYPALWVCLIINTLIIAITYTVKPTIKDVVIYFFSQFTVFQFYTGDWLRGYGVGAPNGALWTISTEIQFYILLAIFVNVLKKWSLRVWSVVITVLAIISWILRQLENWIPSIFNKLFMVSVLPFLYIFLFGVMCYEFRDKLILLFKRFRVPVVVAYIVWSALPKSFKSGVGGYATTC